MIYIIMLLVALWAAVGALKVVSELAFPSRPNGWRRYLSLTFWSVGIAYGMFVFA